MALADALGNLVRFVLLPGQRHDSIGVEPLIPEDSEERGLPLHSAGLVDLGLTLGELWVLDDLAADCAADGTYEFMLAAQPLHLPGGMGSPLNPIALK